MHFAFFTSPLSQRTIRSLMLAASFVMGHQAPKSVTFYTLYHIMMLELRRFRVQFVIIHRLRQQSEVTEFRLLRLPPDPNLPQVLVISPSLLDCIWFLLSLFIVCRSPTFTGRPLRHF